jgi:hypothetical protein
VADRSFASFLVRSLELLELQAPGAYVALWQRLRGVELGISVDGERLVMVSTRRGLQVRMAMKAPALALATRRATLCALLAGQGSLLDAVLADQVVLRGSVDELVVVDEALALYLNGAVRSSGFPALFREFAQPQSLPKVGVVQMPEVQS